VWGWGSSKTKSPVLIIDSKKREYKVRKVMHEVAVVHVWMWVCGCVFVTLLCVKLGQFENKIHQCWIIETVRQGEERCI
jgi:hypothetical protein